MNVMMPLIGYNLLQSVHILSSASMSFADKCIVGITANKEQCESGLEKSLSLATALVPEIGYDRAASLAKEAHKSGKTIREVAKEQGILPDTQIDKLLDDMIKGG